MPVLVASLTASSRPSNFGLKVTVKAQSMIRPETRAGHPLKHAPHAVNRLLDGARQALTVDVSSEVNLADVVVAQHSGVSCVWRVVGSTVVDGAAGGEGQAGLEPVLVDEPPGAVLQLLTAEVRNNETVRPREELPAALRCELADTPLLKPCQISAPNEPWQVWAGRHWGPFKRAGHR